MNRQINETTAVGYDVIKLIAQAYDNLNIYWVITGKGDMFKLEISELSFIPQNLSAKIESPYVAPIYETESLSSDEMVDLRDHKPDRYPFTSMLGVKLFPVIGCSFEPTILAGHYIGAVKLDSYNKIVTENIYYILTKKERMIKRLRIYRFGSLYIAF